MAGGARFDVTEGELKIYYPDGRRFKTFEEVVNDLEEAEKRAKDAEDRAKDAQARATDAEERAARLAERLRQAGIDPDA